MLHHGWKIFVAITCKPLAQKNIMLKIVLKLMVNKLLRYLKSVNTLDSKLTKEK